MDHDTVRAQEPFECFGIPVHVNVEADGSAMPMPLGWNRRNWFLPDPALLGIEALPSSPVAAAVEIDRVR